MKRVVSLMVIVGLLVASAGCCCWGPEGRGYGRRGSGDGYRGGYGEQGRGSSGHGLERK